jgi:hypothetical protein
MFEKGQIEPQVQLRRAIANPKTLILSYPLLRGWGSKIYAEGLFKHPLRGCVPIFSTRKTEKAIGYPDRVLFPQEAN